MLLDRFLENLDQAIEKAPAKYKLGLKKFFLEVLTHTHNSKSKADSQPMFVDFRKQYLKLIQLLDGQLRDLAEKVYLEAFRRTFPSLFVSEYEKVKT